jgi:D-alanyl-D-alanine carboxypeptidase
MRIVLLSLTALLAATPALAQPAPRDTVPQAELVRRLASTLDSVSAAGSFSGVAVLARNGVPVFERAYGMADREAGRPNTLETRFNVGSINKVFTATAVRQLAARGRVHLDSTLVTYLPDYPNPEVARRVTLRQLMEHRAGLGGNVFGVPAGGSRMDLRHNRDFLPLFVAEPLQFEPGSRNQYCNACYVVLGLVVERVSGEDYYDYIRRNVYAPAGLASTDHSALDSLPASTALGYTMGENRPCAATTHCSPAGGARREADTPPRTTCCAFWPRCASGGFPAGRPRASARRAGARASTR